VCAEFGLYRGVSYIPIKSAIPAHWWHFDLDNLLGILLVVKTIAEHVSKRLQSSLGRVRNRLFLGLRMSVEFRDDTNRESTLSRAPPLLLIFSP
jgi:hypothetical protein